jgi:hypothetical protein
MMRSKYQLSGYDLGLLKGIFSDRGCFHYHYTKEGQMSSTIKVVSQKLENRLLINYLLGVLNKKVGITHTLTSENYEKGVTTIYLITGQANIMKTCNVMINNGVRVEEAKILRDALVKHNKKMIREFNQRKKKGFPGRKPLNLEGL